MSIPPRFFDNKLTLPDPHDPQVVQTLQGHLAEMLSAVQQAQHQDASIYTGESGVALMYLRAAAVDTVITRERALDCAADHHASALQHPISRRRFASMLEGSVGHSGVGAVLAHVLGQHDKAQSALQKVLEAGRNVLEALPRGEDEVLYGRAGYLQTLAMVRKHVPGFGREIAEAVISQILEDGRALGAKHGLALCWMWHKKIYLGGAHGISGILQTLLLFPEELSHIDGALASIKEVVVHLVDNFMLPSGNMPSSLWKSQIRDELVQWCHGAPGWVPLACSCARAFPSDASYFLNIANRMCDVVWGRGLLRKGVGLCHGVSGNGYCFLSAYRETGDQMQLQRALAYAVFVGSEWRTLSDADHPYSMFEGLAGAVCFVLDCLNPSLSGFPGYEP
jgi:lantibiotic modifying enzyme